jgi:hypothetical protein
MLAGGRLLHPSASFLIAASVPDLGHCEPPCQLYLNETYRYLLIALALLVLIGIGWYVLQSHFSASRINSANFAKIKNGMAKTEVDAILGSHGFCISFCGLWSTNGESPPWWVANKKSILIFFDEDWRVGEAFFTVENRSLKERFAKYLPD